MKRKTKLLIASMAVLIVMAIAATALSYRRADKAADPVTPLGEGEQDETEYARATNIDYIIMNANDTNADDMYYHIVEIGSGTESGFRAFAEAGQTGDFANYVLDGNKSADNSLVMDPAKIDYHYFNAADVGEKDADKLEIIAKADFIYISNINNAYNKDNDFGEELYNLLHTYAIGDYKPFIIDSPNAGSGGGSGGGSGSGSGGGNSGGSAAPTNATVAHVVDDYFGPSGVYNSTYEWVNTTPAQTFLAGGLGNTKYIGINSKTAQKKWTQLYNAPSADLPEADKNNAGKLEKAGRLARVLVVSNNGTTGILTSNLLGSSAAVDSTQYYVNGPDDTGAYKTTEYIPTGTVYTASTTDFQKFAYSTRYSYRPDFVEVNSIKVTDFATTAIDGYDLIVIESDCKTTEIGQSNYDRLVAAMKAKMHIVYDSSLAGAPQTTDPGNPGDDDAGEGKVEDSAKSRYHQLYYLVATEDGVASYPNIMPTSSSAVNMMVTSKSSSICKPIADLINSSSYRGIGGPTGTSNSFTVLEIQPCYPIDESIAASQKTYYKQGTAMAPSGMTKEQVGNDKEYYAWELSEAKVAAALGLQYDDVKVVHMSVDEFAANHTELLGNYDMVYLGGNRSALANGTYIYTSQGELAEVRNFSFLGNGGIKFTSLSGEFFFSVDRFNPRDLSTYNLKQLNEFAKAGMPVIISKELTQAYTVNDGTVESGSKMYSFLSDNISKSNVLSDFDPTKTVKDSQGGLGDSMMGYVEVFDTDTADALRTIYNNNTKRLLLAVTSRPAQYNLYDKSTKLTSTALNFKFDVSAESYTAKLYIDHNNNGAFEEAAVKTDTSNSGTLSYSLSEYKGGLIYWKLEVSSGKMTASSTGATYIKPNGDKQDVRVLEILPCEKVDYTCNYGPQQGVTLMFCTECQRANMPIKWNPIVTNPWSDTYRTYSSMYMGADLTSNFGNGGPYGRPITDDGIISNSSMDAVYIGKHEHKFGIVKYGGSEVYSDPAKGEYDDWDWNFADELSDMYNFHIDMMTTREYEALDAKIKSDYTPLIGDLTELAGADRAVTKAKNALDEYVKGAEYTTAVTNVETAIAHIRDQGVYFENSTKYYTSEMQRLLDEKCYYDFFSSFGSVSAVNAALEMNEKEMWTAYEAWARANDKKIDLTDAYMQALYKYNFLNTEGKDWLTGSYSSVVIGACENFGNDDLAKDACGALNEYATKGGQIITFHECFGRLKDNPTAGNITAAIMDAAGVNAYSDTQRMSSDAGQENPAAGSMRSYYKYGSINWTHVAKWANAADQTNGIFNPGTDQAVINNRCAVNIFPFTLSDKLKITGTHPVGYAIDTDDLNVTPLYTLTTSNYQNEYQTVYPASPVDGSDNSFIYSSGNFYYCGAGHSKVTGLNKNNNDERRLYINIICSSVANSSIMPEEPGIDVFDYSDGTGEENNDFVVPDGDNGYIYELEENDEIPEFSFKATVDAKTQIDYVNIYYKLDKSFLYKTDQKELKLALAFNNEKDKKIADKLDANAGTLYDIDATKYPSLKLTKEMFDAYGGNYTYIIIEVVDTAENKFYQKIKVTKKVHLFDLT